MAHSEDPDKVIDGIKTRKEIDLPAAIVACQDALEQYPDEARFHYQLGAALYYHASAGDVDAALNNLRAASDRGYRQATFVLGYIYSLNDKVPQDLCRTGHLWQRTLSQGHPWSKFWFAKHQLNGSFKNCSFYVSRADIDRYVMSFAALDLDESAERRTDELIALLKETRAEEARARANGNN
ncbi:hypothetical protein AB1K62_05315 [Parasphingorhabdus sp. JC815]|uniref:hypothetical protein n=1 Tax=Parasphingorhabdus sp. JC815 TaxID=3232140 RepID=UPI0034592E1D